MRVSISSTIWWKIERQLSPSVLFSQYSVTWVIVSWLMVSIEKRGSTGSGGCYPRLARFNLGGPLARAYWPPRRTKAAKANLRVLIFAKELLSNKFKIY